MKAAIYEYREQGIYFDLGVIVTFFRVINFLNVVELRSILNVLMFFDMVRFYVFYHCSEAL